MRSAQWLASSLKLAARCPVSECWPSCILILDRRYTATPTKYSSAVNVSCCWGVAISTQRNAGRQLFRPLPNTLRRIRALMWARPILLAGRVADFCCLPVPLCTKSRKKRSETSGCTRRTFLLLRSVMVCSHYYYRHQNQQTTEFFLYFLKLHKTAGVPPQQLLQFYVTVICPVLEYCTQPTGRHTDRATPCATIGRNYVVNLVRCDLIITCATL